MNRFSAETGLRASVGIFLLSCTFLTTTYNTTFAFDRPINSAVLTCYLAGASLLILGRFFHHLPKHTISHSHKYSAIPLTEPGEETPRELSSPISHVDRFPYTTKSRSLDWWIKIALVSGIGCIRLAFYGEITRHIECAPVGYGYAIPFLIALYDYWRNQRCRSIEKYSPADRSMNSQLRALLTLFKRTHYVLFRSRLKYVISASFLMVGGFMAASFYEGRESTYICPIMSGYYLRIRFFRFLSVILDSLVLIAAAELAREGPQSQEGRGKQGLRSWGYGFLGVAMVWSVIGLIISREDEDKLFFEAHYLRSALGQSLLVTLLVLSAAHIIPHYGIVGLSILAGFILEYFQWASALFNGQEPFPFILGSHALVALVATFFGAIEFLWSRTASEEEPKFLYKFNIFMRFLVSFLFGIGLILVFNQPILANVHPIDLLIYEGRNRHAGWMAQARGSSNLEEAVMEYQRRYRQHPPPGFDQWYEYAASRSSVVIDEFDQIHDDLLPFRAISPERIRALTHELATNPFNDLGGISIRNGSARVQEGIKPTHAWMVTAAADMIEKFAKHLPDMDLVFNLNDEPRVAVPWETASMLKDQARGQAPVPVEEVLNGWSMDRESKWAPIEPADQTPESVFTDYSWHNIFDRYVSQICPPSSKARSQRIWDHHGICVSCVRPHSLGQFPLDWNAASDICHQPDLAKLHGFLISPASFKVSQGLIPVFSQSKISGFSDILFPSPWNYIDKVKYEPSSEYPDVPYTDKENTLFWIGSTSEGMSIDGGWKGIPRQRFSHLVNNNTFNQVSVLLPTNQPLPVSKPKSDLTYAYQVMDGVAPREELGLSADVQLSTIVRCGDCDQQEKEFGLASWMDFQNHWKYRYLFDLDGAGFSGRFLPFLQSHSLPFKTGLFRQWFDSRVTSWLHYVPIDLRLHGVWSTLAYFAGVDVSVGVTETGEKIPLMERHDVQGTWIAEEGRKWAEQALRKEDMEIYFFRLLLEWGRLTDDRRDYLGFQAPVMT